jgi:hypothetical protein
MPDGRRARVSGPDRDSVMQQIQSMTGGQGQGGQQQPQQQMPPQSMEELVLGTRPPRWDAEDRMLGGVDRRGMTSLRARFDIGGADNNAERMKAFQHHFPKGTLDQAPGTGTWIYKENRDDPDETWKTLEREAKDFFNFSPKNPAAGAASLAGEIWGPILGEVAALAATKGGGFIGRTVASGLGGAGGEAVRQGTQEIRGIGDQSIGSQGLDTLTAGAFGAGGYAVSEPVMRLMNLTSGRGMFKERPEAREIMGLIDQANAGLPKSLQIPQLSPGQALDDAFFRRFEDQLLAITGSVIRDHRRQQVAGLRGLIHNQVDLKAIERAPDAAAEALRLADGRIRGMVANPRMYAQDAGDVLAESLQAYRRDSQTVVRNAYGEASQFGSPQFDLGPAVESAKSLTKPLQYMRAMSEEDTALMRSLGLDPANPANRSMVAQRRAPDEVQGVARQIAEADPNSIQLENLMAWREELGDLAFPGADQIFRRPNRAAQELYNAITEVIENPSNLEGTFGAAWRSANDKAARRFKTLEAATVTQLARADDQLTVQTVAQLADTLIQPNQYDNLVLLSGLGESGRKAGRAMQEVFETRVLGMENSAAMRAEINRFDPQTLNLLMPQARQRQYRDMIAGLEGLEATNVQQSLQAQSRAVPLLNDILDNRSSRGLDYLFDMVDSTGGVNGEFGTALRHGIKDRLISKFMVSEGDRAVRVSALNKEMRALRERGLDRYLTTADKQAINDIKKMGEFFDLIGMQADAGTSIRAMEITSGLYDFANPSRMARSAWERFKAGGLSRWVMSDSARKMLVGRKDYADFDWARFMIISSGEIARESNEAERNNRGN